jgi:hypothetical protein
MFLTCIWEVPGSNVGQDTDYYDSLFPVILLSPSVPMFLQFWEMTIMHSFVYSSQPLQPLSLGPGHFFSFVILYTVGKTPWTGDQSVARPLPTYRGNTNT